ncbi:MAG: aldo/keto reductase [Pseudomonadota bacterium]
MKSVLLGRTGITVSSLCYGTMSFGGDADDATSFALYRACRDAGISFFDCAATYNGGRSEALLGEFVAADRDAITITTKCGYGSASDPRGNGSRLEIVTSVEASLRRLKTDRLDVLFMHRFDPATDLHVTLKALEDVVRAGKVLHLGASNYAAWQIAKALGLSARHGWAGFAVIQPMYNLVKRQAEVELLPLAEEEGLGVISYSPLGGGLLTGKYARDGAGRLTANDRYARRYGPDWMHKAATGLSEMAEKRGLHPASLAVAWAGAHPGVTAPIIGARSVEQLRPSLASADIEMTQALYAEISALAPAPPPATDRLEEQD